MNQKHIAYIALISMKYLFNLEHEISEQLFIVFVLSIVCLKQMVFETVHNINLQIEETATFIKYSIGCMKEQMHNKNNNYQLQTQHVNL
ncbi:MAG: hypothetical protein P4L41_10690 [Flavipsychrobacter sp.]|nr:hypothetical protein [Flavipsychrobacter sp.]